MIYERCSRPRYSQLFEGIDLEIDALIFRANAGVASFHFRSTEFTLLIWLK